MSENENSPYFYQWDGSQQPVKRPPLPPIPEKTHIAPLNIPRGHIQMASLDLSDEYSLTSSSRLTEFTEPNSVSDQSYPSSFIMQTTGSCNDIDLQYRPQPSDMKLPPLPHIPLFTREEIDPSVQKKEHKLSLASLENEESNIDSDQYDFSRPQYVRFEERQCSIAVSFVLFTLSLLAVPFLLCIYLGFLDRSVGNISKRWKMASLLAFITITVTGIVGIGVGLGIGLS